MIEVPSEFPLPEEAFQRQRSLLGAQVEAVRGPSRRKRRGLVVAIALAILVVGLLVTPAFGIGGRLLDLIQGAPRPLEVGSPVWSPDGRKVVFPSRRDGNWEIYVVNADGSGLRRLTRNPARDSVPAWSPDVRKIAFVRHHDPTHDAVYVMNADGSGQRMLALRAITAISPDPITEIPQGER